MPFETFEDTPPREIYAILDGPEAKRVWTRDGWKDASGEVSTTDAMCFDNQAEAWAEKERVGPSAVLYRYVLGD